MGLATVSATVIICVSLFAALELVTGNLLPVISDINTSYRYIKNREVEKVQTTINITAVSASANGSNPGNYDYNITIKNTGGVTLQAAKFTILLNGTKRDYSYSNAYLFPVKETYFYVDNITGAGEKRLKVIAHNGVSDYYELTII